MDWFRVKHTIGMFLTLSPMKRAEYLRKKSIFHHVGKNCMVMFRKIPLYPELISLGNNVWVASQVTFVTHDAIHHMLNYALRDNLVDENIGCIEIKDNVFIGSNTTLLPNVSIGPNAIIGAGSIVSKSIGSGVYVGNPARYICSFDDFINKRIGLDHFRVDRSSSWALSQETVDACWKAFKAREKQE